MRLFVALNLSYSVIQLFITIQEQIKLLCTEKELRTIRFVPVDRLHITLRPPMIVGQKGYAQLINTLKTISFSSFGLCTDKLDFFAKTDILWVGIQESRELMQLTNDIQRVTHIFGNPHEQHNKQFIGHITLARSFHSNMAQEMINKVNKQLPPQCFLITHFILKETMLNSAGQVIDYHDRQLFDHY